MAEKVVKVWGTRESPWVKRAIIVLNNKSENYELFLEDKLPAESSELLLKSNPILIHEKHRLPEHVVVGEVVKCFPCTLVEYLLGEEMMKRMKNKFRKSDFLRFPQGWKVCDGNNVPAYLNYLHEELGGSVTATATLSEDMIALVRALFYAAIDEMHKMKLEDITNEDVMRKWGCVMRDAKKMGLDVEFAEEHLKKIAHAYFQLPELDAAREQPAICSMSERESFEDGAPLTKGLLLFATSERSA